MELSEININKQIRFWAILGPFMTLLIFSLYLIKQSPTSLCLALMALCGLVCCWQWKMKGLIVSLVLIIGLLAFHFPSVEIGERFWFLGLAMATSLSLVVTVLSHEEIEGLLGSLEGTTHKHLQKISELTTLNQQGIAEREKLTIDLDWVTEQKSDLEAKLMAMKQEHEQINSHNLDEAQKLAEKYQVKASEQTSTDPYEKLYKQLQHQFSQKGVLLDQTRKELFAAQEQVACMSRDIEEMTKYKRDDYSVHLEKEIVDLFTELETRDKMYRDEITELEELVGALLQRN